MGTSRVKIAEKRRDESLKHAQRQAAVTQLANCSTLWLVMYSWRSTLRIQSMPSAVNNVLEVETFSTGSRPLLLKSSSLPHVRGRWNCEIWYCEKGISRGTKLQGWNLEIARHELEAQTCRGGICETWNQRHKTARVETARHGIIGKKEYGKPLWVLNTGILHT